MGELGGGLLTSSPWRRGGTAAVGVVAVGVDPLNDEEILEVEIGSVNTTGL